MAVCRAWPPNVIPTMKQSSSTSMNLIEAHPHLLEHLHLIGHKADSSLFAMPLALGEGISGLKHNLGIKDRFDLLPPRRDVVASVGLVDGGDPLLCEIDVLRRHR